MKISITQENNRTKKIIFYAMAVIFWLAVWQIISILVGSSVILASPFEVFKTLLEKARTWEFYQTIGSSLGRILLGFFMGFFGGILLATAAARFPAVRILLKLFMTAIKSIPVAGFIILALFWLDTRQLSSFIGCLIVLPIIYENVYRGIEETDPQLLEMAEVFQMPLIKRICYIYLFSIAPYLKSACNAGIGLCFKSAVAAEVIGICEGTIGGELYNAKVYLETPDVFAWCIVLLILSVAAEKLCLFILEKLLGWNFRACKGKHAGQKQIQTSQDIYIEHVEKKFGEMQVLSDFSVDIKAGTTYTLRWPSGAGKSTLLRLICGLEKADQGKVDTGENTFAVDFQEDRLLPFLDAVGNVMAACGVSEKSARAALLATGLTEQDLDKETRELSGGQKRRVALVRAMESRHAVLLLDEPFTGMDEDTKKKVAAYIEAARNGRTIILARHE